VPALAHGRSCSTDKDSPQSPEDGESSMDGRTPLLSSGAPGRRRPRAYRAPMRPIDRRRVGPERRRVRDEWNCKELMLFDELSRRDLDLTNGLGEEELHSLLSCMSDGKPTRAELVRTMRLATRGKASCTSMEQLHYALRAERARQSLPPNVLRLLATTDFGPRGAADAKQLHALLELLNDGQPALMAEAEMVLHDATLMAGSVPPGRAEIVPATVAWYLHVERRKTSRWMLLQLWLSRWTPKKEYHAALLDSLASTDLEATDSLDGALTPAAGPPGCRERLARCCRSSFTTGGLVIALLVPSIFFALLVYLGAERGDDRCPRDLNGLITWFGILGVAAIVVDLSKGRSEAPSVVDLALRGILLCIPWVGTFWTVHLTHSERSLCGHFLSTWSSFLWIGLVLVELFTVCFLLWELSVLSENERSLQHSLGVSEDP